LQIGRRWGDAENHRYEAGRREALLEDPGQRAVAVRDVGFLVGQCPDDVAEMQQACVDAVALSGPLVHSG